MLPFQKELAEFCSILNKNQVEYMVIGGIAVNLHGYTRATGDADIWYLPTEKNFRNLIRSIQTFGYDTGDLERLENYHTKGFIRIPLERFSIELLSIIDGNIEFSAALQRAEKIVIDGISIPVMGYDDLIQNKIMSRRSKDMEDIKQLERRRNLGN